MIFSKQSSADGTVIALEGAFTFKDHHSFRTLLNDLNASPGRRHALDLSLLEFLDSAALGMLLIADDEAKAGGWTLTLRKPSGDVAKLMELSSMESLFTIEK